MDEEEQTIQWAAQELEKLELISKHVHNALRMLRVGETGIISCGKKFPVIEVRQYVTAYALHKRKWFDLKHDAISNALQATRVKMPSFLPTTPPDEPEEP
jgi:hypothetical protein